MTGQSALRTPDTAHLLRFLEGARHHARPPTAGLPLAAEKLGALAESDSLCLDSFRALRAPVMEEEGLG